MAHAYFSVQNHRFCKLVVQSAVKTQYEFSHTIEFNTTKVTAFFTFWTKCDHFAKQNGHILSQTYEVEENHRFSNRF